MAAEEVEGIDGLLIAIFIWLPPILIFKFRCVSKRWKNIIDDRFFLESYHANLRNRQLYYGGGRILAFIQTKICFFDRSPMKILPVAQMNDLDIKQIPRSFGDFITTSKGHILCHNGNAETPFLVVNPLTRTWVKVPQNNLRDISKFGLAFEENMHEFITSFSIVGVDMMGVDEDNTLLIETYSSKTSKWTTSSLIVSESVSADYFEQPFVSKCVFHWDTNNGRLAVYDPSEDENHLQLINLPQYNEFGFRYRGKMITRFTRSSNDDVLWVGIEELNILKLWKLPKDENGGYKRAVTIDANEWILMHKVATQSLCSDIRLFFGNKKWKEHADKTVDDSVYYCKFDAFSSWNPMEVFLSHKLRVFRCNLESKTVELIPYRGVPLDEKSFHMRHPYVEPLSLSSYYALSGGNYDD